MGGQENSKLYKIAPFLIRETLLKVEFKLKVKLLNNFTRKLGLVNRKIGLVNRKTMCRFFSRSHFFCDLLITYFMEESLG